jgi:hypothetical protein
MKTCLSCGQQIPIQYNVCPYCQKPTAPGTEKKDSALPIVAGVFNILGLALACYFLYSAIIGTAILSAYGLGSIGFVCIGIAVIGVVFSLIGAIFCFMKKHWGLALVGSILGMIFGGLIFGLIALICVAVSKEAFSN